MNNVLKPKDDIFKELMRKYEFVSVDIGYGYVKAVSLTGKRVVFPSMVGVGAKANEYGAVFGAKNDDIDNICVEYNGISYYIGQSAIDETDAKPNLETDRKNLTTMLLINIAVQLVTEGSDKPVLLTTGLPLSFYEQDNKAFRKYIEDQNNQLPVTWLSGTHKGKEIHTKIEKALIFPQGASAVFTALNNHEGKANYPDMMEKGALIALIDIGFRTTDYMVVELLNEKGTPNPLGKYSGTISDLGISNLHAALENEFIRRTNAKSLPENIKQQLLENGKIVYKGKVIDLTQTIEAVKEDISKRIFNGIFEKWRDNMDYFYGIFFAGGGSILLEDSLKAKFEDREVYRILEAQYANAIGYSRLGKVMFKMMFEKKQQQLEQQSVQ